MLSSGINNGGAKGSVYTMTYIYFEPYYFYFLSITYK